MFNFRKIVTFFTIMMMAGFAQANDFSNDEEPTFVKCGTPEILRAYLNGAQKPAARYARDSFALSEAGHFRVHYDTTGYHAPDMTDEDINGIPDYIDSTLVYCEYAWDLEVNQLGYQPPISDNGLGGGDEVDVYIRNFGTNGAYGMTYPETMDEGVSAAYIVIDNDYSESHYRSKGYNGLRVTTAHEFFHVIQFGYVTDYNLLWWMEQSAVWMEERAWDDVNDYISYLNLFFFDKRSSLDSNDGSYMYGAALWPLYLSKRFGDDLIRLLWNELSLTGNHTISAFDNVIPSGLSAAFNEFGIWNYFTRTRANTVDFYPDGDKFKYMVGIDWRENFTPSTLDSMGINALTNRYIELLFVGNWGEKDALKIDATPYNGSMYAHSLLFYNSPQDYRIHTFRSDNDIVPLGGKWDVAVLVTSCLNTNGYGYWYSLDTEITEWVAAVSAPLYAFTMNGVYPNPFNPSTTISFSIPQAGHVSVRVYSVNGQKVADLYDGDLEAGEKRLLWKPENLAGGIYLVTVTTPFGSKTSKLLLLK